MTDLSKYRAALAELCGYTRSYESPSYDGDTDFGAIYQRQDGFEWVENWRPDEDIAQAIRCLDAWRDQRPGDWRIESKRTGEMAYWITLSPYPENLDARQNLKLRDGPLSKAICLAIVQALGLEERP